MDVPGLALILLVGLAIGWAWLVGHTAWMLMRPPRRSYAWAVARSLPGDPSELPMPGFGPGEGLSVESWSFRSRGLDLPVWDIRGLDAAGPAVILTHGWGDSRVTMLASGRVAALLPLVSRLVVWDLPGHGDAAGTCSLGPREAEDLSSLVERVRREATDGPEPAAGLVLYGFSLGAVVSLRLRGMPGVAAVIAEAPYRTPLLPALNTLRLRGLPYRSNLGPALAVVALVHRTAGVGGAAPTSGTVSGGAPVLVIHGTADSITGLEEGRAVAEAHAGAFVPIAGGQHTSLFFEPETRERATDVIRRWLTSRR